MPSSPGEARRPHLEVADAGDAQTVSTCVVVVLTGELDLSHAEHLRHQLEAALPTDDVIVDVAGVPFIDSVALGVLARAAVLHRDSDSRVVLCGARPFVRRVLSITRLGDFLPAVSTVEQARALLGAVD